MTRRRGFTLVEVAVALAAAAMVLITARAMSGAIGDNAARVSRAAAAQDATANTAALLADLLRSAPMAGPDSSAFVGTRRFAAFTSWCRSPGGWRERCDVTVLLDTSSGRTALTLYAGRHSGRLVIRDSVEGASLLFLASAASGGEWRGLWAQSHAYPLALGVAHAGDTAILRIRWGGGT